MKRALLAASVAVLICSGTTAATAQARTAAACPNPPQSATVAYESLPGVPADAVSVDIHVPAGRVCSAPVVMWVHGGSFTGGDKANQLDDKINLFTGQGWILVSVNYRLTVPGDPGSAHYPDHYNDVAHAVAWVHGNIAGYGGDPARVALLGHSAGADIVSNVADNPAYLAATGLPLTSLVCAGPLDTAGFDKSQSDGEQAMYQEALGNDPNYVADTSPTLYARSGIGIPPTIGVYRGADIRQQIELTYLRTLRAHGVPARTIDATSLTHEEVNTSIGAPFDTVMTPPLMQFLTHCFSGRPFPPPVNYPAR